MARPIKSDEMHFPVWRPQFRTRMGFESQDFKSRYNTLRSSSDGFISNKVVRDMIMRKCNYKCVECGSCNDLQIDHIVSVYLVAKGEYPVSILNTFDNLSVLCRKCNAKKLPDRI
jgi:5-methylcytosine-specific restriction endonuclease McrA